MRARLVAIALAMPALLALPASARPPVPPPAPQPQPPASTVAAFTGSTPIPIREDPDGAMTLSLLIDDGEGGSYRHSEPIADAAPTFPGAKQCGVFTHAWSDTIDGKRTPLETLGIWCTTATGQRVRIPMLVAENMGLDLEDVLETLAGEMPMFDHAFPFLVSHVSPDSVQLRPWTASFPRGGGAFRNEPFRYVWFARKVTSAGAAWSGVYMHRTGFSKPKHSASHRLVLGAATRTASGTSRIPALFVENHAHRKELKGRAYIESTYVAGLAGPGGDIPLTRIRFSESRRDSDPERVFDHAEHHAGGMEIGVYANGAYRPVLGMTTTQRVEHGSDRMNDGRGLRTRKTTRRTDIGIYDDQRRFTPLLGVRYDGERQPQDIWLSDHIANGGPGDQRAGDWLLTTGAYVSGAWRPLAGAAYDDDFAGRRFLHRARYSAGTFDSAGAYLPLVATTYDGEVPLLTSQKEIEQGRTGSRYSRWESSTGAIAQGRYVPVVGVRFEPGANGRRAQQWTVVAGTYAADYRAFVPLAYASYDGETAAGEWAAMLLAERMFGLPLHEGNWDVTIGAGDRALPLLLAQYRQSAPDGRSRPGEVSSVILGVHGPSGPVPLVAITLTAREQIYQHGEYVVAYDAEVGAMQPSYLALACADIRSRPWSVTPRAC